jgi:hypothetical protein
VIVFVVTLLVSVFHTINARMPSEAPVVVMLFAVIVEMTVPVEATGVAIISTPDTGEISNIPHEPKHPVPTVNVAVCVPANALVK